MKKILLLLLVVLALVVAGCTDSQPTVDDSATEQVPTEEVTLCTADYRPVCGINGQTYGNECTANAANVPVSHDGECLETIGTGGVIRILADTRDVVIDVSLKAGEESSIQIVNERDEVMRLSIAQLDVQADVLENTQQIVYVTPKYKGLYPVELNGAQLGTIRVE